MTTHSPLDLENPGSHGEGLKAFAFAHLLPLTRHLLQERFQAPEWLDVKVGV